MSLSLYELQQIKKVRLDSLYEGNQKYWDVMSIKSHIFAELNFQPENEGYIIHLEDVAKFLMPVLEVDHNLDKYLGINKLREKYWIRYCCGYILDQYWDKFRKGKLPHLPSMIFEQAQLSLESNLK